jgi:hypothetical protein
MALSREEKIKLLEVQIKQLKSSETKQKRKDRARELILIGSAISAVVDRAALLLAIKDKYFMEHIKNYPDLNKYIDASQLEKLSSFNKSENKGF